MAPFEGSAEVKAGLVPKLSLFYCRVKLFEGSEETLVDIKVGLVPRLSLFTAE